MLTRAKERSSSRSSSVKHNDGEAIALSTS
jgi:hypothetical protein